MTSNHTHPSPVSVARLAEIAEQMARPRSRRTLAAPCPAEYETAVARLADMINADDLLNEIRALADSG